MAKKKKRKPQTLLQSAWTLPPPAIPEPGQAPDLTAHLAELVKKAYLASCTGAPTEKGLYKYFEESTRLHRDYLEALTDASPDLMSTKELSELDAIDASSLTDEPWPDGLLAEQLPYAAGLNNPIHAFLPCFSKGIFLLPDIPGTVQNYVQFEILDLNETARTFHVRIRDYCICNDGFAPGIGCDAEVTTMFCWKRPDGTIPAPTITIDKASRIDFTDLYTRISPKTLGWDRDTARAWRRTILQNAVDQAARFTAMGMDMHLQLMYRFLSACLAVNASLSANKPAILKDAPPAIPIKTTDKPEPTREPVDNTQDPVPVPRPERRVRSIGLIRFTSEKTPHPAAKAVRNYKLASWTARGHVRHYKNGKQVYIKPTVRHRKAALTTHEPAPSTIKIVDNRPNKE